MHYLSNEVIDAKMGIVNDYTKLLLGFHFANDRSYGEGNYEKRKKYNAKFSTNNIRKDTDILVDYNLQYK